MAFYTLAAAAASSLFAGVAAQPFQPGSGLTPLGSLRTSDYEGPYNISLLSTQVRAAFALHLGVQ